MFSNTSAELSLNTPSKCISPVSNDTSNHRFLVGTCALSSNQSNSNSSSVSNSNSVYLLRYHEEMSELAVDAGASETVVPADLILSAEVLDGPANRRGVQYRSR